MTSDIGIIGIGVMGKNLVLNLVDHNYVVSAYDVDERKLVELKNSELKDIKPCTSMESLVNSLNTPRIIWIMVKAGHVVDTVINELIKYLDQGDIIIDGGNSNFYDTQRRYRQLLDSSIEFVGMGVSGGSEGARYGPSLMPGGSSDAWPHLKPILESISAKSDTNIPCVAWMGLGGAGHLVKTIHNGIEYADMELIAEIYHIQKQILGKSNEEMASIFERWDRGELSSFLMEITANILRTKEAKVYLIDSILDKAGQKGTGKWSVQLALDAGIPNSIIGAAVHQRIISSQKDTRVQLHTKIKLPSQESILFDLEDLDGAMLLTRLLILDQGLQTIRQYSEDNSWGTDIRDVVSVWSAGCIIRSRLLEFVKNLTSKELPNILFHPDSIHLIQSNFQSLKRVLSSCLAFNLPVPVLSTAFQYLVSMTHDILPANLIQAQRDYFGAHGFQRVGESSSKLSHGNWRS